MSNEAHYTAFLVCWQGDDSQRQWRATVENVLSGQKLQFVSKSELLCFLRQSLYKGELAKPFRADAQEEI